MGGQERTREVRKGPGSWLETLPTVPAAAPGIPLRDFRKQSVRTKWPNGTPARSTTPQILPPSVVLKAGPDPEVHWAGMVRTGDRWAAQLLFPTTEPFTVGVPLLACTPTSAPSSGQPPGGQDKRLRTAEQTWANLYTEGVMNDDGRHVGMTAVSMTARLGWAYLGLA